MNETIERTVQNCYFANEKSRNGCSLVRDEYACVPKICKWHRTRQEMLESLYKASKNYEKATGLDDYAVRFCPMVLRNDLIELRAKRKREEYGTDDK